MERRPLTRNGMVVPQIVGTTTSEEWRQIEQAYAEIQRRDAHAERRTWRAERLAMALLGLLGLTLGAVLWLAVRGQQVQAFVQVVQMDEKGQLVQQGIPQDLLAYQPPDGLFTDMLTAWIVKTRWRGTDVTLTRVSWAWAYLHTCGQASRLLQAIEEREQPFKPSKKLISVELKNITKIAAPESYQVLWTETSTDPIQPLAKTQLWSGTFTVGRFRPATMADTLENRLGLCVTSYDVSAVSPQP